MPNARGGFIRQKNHTMLARDAESHRHSVLLIEDDMDTRDAVEAFAEAAGFDVVAHHDAAMALNYLKGASHTCLILLDLYMPGMDGFAFRRAQLADPALADIPTVILSGGSLVDEKAARANPPTK